MQHYTGDAANASLDGRGNLAITVAQADRDLNDLDDGCQHTSARLITKHLKSFRYGLAQT